MQMVTIWWILPPYKVLEGASTLSKEELIVTTSDEIHSEPVAALADRNKTYGVCRDR